MAHHARANQRRGGFRHQRQIDEGRTEFSARGGEGHVAMQVHRRADADGKTIDAGKKRLFEARQFEDEAVDVATGLRIHGDGHEVGEVIAGGEAAGHAEDDDRTYAVVLVGLDQRIGHGFIHRPRQRVLLVRAVHADDDNAFMRLRTFDQDMVGHGFLLPDIVRTPATCARRPAHPRR